MIKEVNWSKEIPPIDLSAFERVPSAPPEGEFSEHTTIDHHVAVNAIDHVVLPLALRGTAGVFTSAVWPDREKDVEGLLYEIARQMLPTIQAQPEWAFDLNFRQMVAVAAIGFRFEFVRVMQARFPYIVDLQP